MERNGSLSQLYANSFQIVEFSLSSSIYRHTVRKKNETGNAHRLIQQRYSDDVMLLLSQAAFLDPRLKSLPFLSLSDKNDLVQAMERDLAKVYDSTHPEPPASATTTREEPPEKRRKGEHQLMNLIDDIMHSVQDDLEAAPTVQGIHEKIKAEIARYSSEPHYSGDPLKWWKINASRYPLLLHLARKYLCIPATSVPSECVFSSAGHIVNRKRTCLDPSSVNMLFFLAENLQ